MTSFAEWVTAIYSASIVDKAMVCYRTLLQLTALFLNLKIYPLIDFLELIFPLQSESLNLSSLSLFIFLYNIPSSMVFLRYQKVYLRISQ